MKRISTVTPWNAILVAMFLSFGIWPFSSPQAYAEDAALPSDALDVVEAEWAILQQKSLTNDLDPDEEARRDQLSGLLMQRMIDARLGRFTLEGVVVDQNGNPLEDVSLLVNKRRMVGFDRWKDDDELINVNGQFSFSIRGYHVVRLYAEKNGYYPANVRFSAPDSAGHGSHEEAAVDRRNVRIVLEKMGDITQLTEQDFKLTFRRQDGISSGEVVIFDWKKWELRRRSAGSLWPEPVSDLLAPDQLPPRCLYVLPAVNEDGHIVSIDKAQPHWHRPLMLPQELRLVLNDPEGGLIVYDQKEGEQAFWSMKRAPEDGYEQELVLDADWLFRRAPMMTTKPDDGIYFFFKVDGRYGKGRIETPQFTEGNYALEVSIRLRVQMDGTRNLDTGRR